MKKLIGKFLGLVLATIYFAGVSGFFLSEILAPETGKGEAIVLAFLLITCLMVTVLFVTYDIRSLKEVCTKHKENKLERIKKKQKKVLELNSKRHFYLYAKGWYKKTDILQDLKVICGTYSGLDPNDIKLGDIFVVLSEEVYKYINTLNAFMHFVDDLASISAWIYRDIPRDIEYYWIRVLRRYMNILSITRVHDDEDVLILNLGDPDPKILPLWDSVE